MLVANPGQTATYGLHSKKPCVLSTGSAASTSNISLTSGSTKNAINSLNNKSSRIVFSNNSLGSTTNAKALPPKLVAAKADNSTNKYHSIIANSYSNTLKINSTSSSRCISSKTATNTSTLMKTLSVRLNRGTEFLKETVQKALISKIPSHLSSVLNLNLYSVPPTVTHRFPAERLNASSADSLKTEMCHFMPIRTAPTTPWKSNSKSRGASLKMPKACAPKKLYLNRQDGAAPDIAVDGHVQFRPKPNSTILTKIFTTPDRRSAFVSLVKKMAPTVKSDNNVAGEEVQKTDSKKIVNDKKNRRRRSLGLKWMPMTTTPIITRNSVQRRKQATARGRCASARGRATSARGGRVSVKRLKAPSKKSSKTSLRKQNTTTSSNKNRKNNKNNNKNSINGEMAKPRRIAKRRCNDAVASDPNPDTFKPSLRRSARLSKDSSTAITKSRSNVSIPTITTAARRNLKRKLVDEPSPVASKIQKRSWTLFSPPVTRSRRKLVPDDKLITALRR